MRLLAFFLNDSEYGKILRGAERRFFEVSVHLKNLGVKIFALEYDSLNSEKWGKSGYFPIKTKRRFSNNALLSALTAVIVSLIACVKCKCEIIYVACHCDGLFAPYIVSCLCKKPLVIVFHHIIQSMDFREKNPIKLRAYRKAICMAVSEVTANEVKKCFHVRDVTVVGNGVNFNLFKIFNSKDKKYDAVYLGRISEEKGVFDLLRAWKNVLLKMPSTQLLLIGGIPNYTEEKLYKTIQELQLKENVSVSGFVSDKEMAQLLASSKIFVLPSRIEGFGLAVGEAMAAGLPCILSNLPALKENFHSAAVFVEPKNVEELAQAILALLSDPKKCRNLKKRGQKLIKQFSWEAVAKKELEVFKSVIKH